MALMDLPIIGDIIKLADKKFKTKAEREQAVRDFVESNSETLMKIDVAQTQVNIAEQKFGNGLSKIWRPLTGLGAAIGFWIIGVIVPVLTNVVRLMEWWENGGTFTPYLPDWQIVGLVLTGMLGLTTARSYEKTKGIHKT